jgi:hypothetical protein
MNALMAEPTKAVSLALADAAAKSVEEAFDSLASAEGWGEAGIQGTRPRVSPTDVA